VPAGGATGQVLTKTSATDYATAWSPASGAFVPLDGVQPAGTRILASKLVSTDAQPAFQINGDGTIQWGPGGATAPDTNLYRTASQMLRTDSNMQVGGQLQGFSPVYAMYNDSLGRQMSLGFTGSTNFPAIYWGNALDTALFRSSQTHLSTLAANYLHVGKAVYSSDGTATQIALGDDGSGHATIFFNSNLDTSILRSAAGVVNIGANLICQQFWYAGCITGAVGGSQSYKFPMYNQNGTFLGYVPIYSS
jgi:hypothetical protein